MNKNNQDTAPRIHIIYSEAHLEPAAAHIGYGIEEEGLPFRIDRAKGLPSEAYLLSQNTTLGVSVEVLATGINIFSKLLNEEKPLLQYDDTTAALARAAGKNAARTIKRKPFVDMDEQPMNER